MSNYAIECGIRLTVPQKTKIDLIKDSVPKPAGYLPPNALPTWNDMALEQKLPQLPAPKGAMYFTRGPLAKTLLRQHSRYTTDDPLNLDRIPSDKYEPLHDPVGRLEQNKFITDFLRTNEYVNENGQVICSLKEFNRYRKYLATLYNDKVREKVQELDQLQEFERETTRELLHQELYAKGQGKEAIRAERIAAAQKFLQQKAELQRRRFQMNATVKAQRIRALEEEKMRKQAAKSKEMNEKKKLQEEKQANKLARELEQTKANLHKVTLMDLKSSAQRNHFLKEKKILHEQKLAQWYDAKIVSAAERLARENEIQAMCEHDLKRRAFHRQKYMERLRAELPIRIANRKAEEERLEGIVRKYAMRWLNKVREIMKRSVDPQHTSLWYTDHKNILKDGVKYLYQQSGHEKLDDLVLNILKLKQSMKQQILIEEEEEEEE